jgi:hypothetical protein
MVTGYDKMIIDVLSGKYNNTIENTLEHKEEYDQYGEKMLHKFKEDLFKAYKLEDNYSNNCVYAEAHRKGKFDGYYGVLNHFNAIIKQT